MSCKDRLPRQYTHGSWSNSRSYAASSAVDSGAEWCKQKAGGSWRSCSSGNGSLLGKRDPASTAKPTHLHDGAAKVSRWCGHADG